MKVPAQSQVELLGVTEIYDSTSFLDDTNNANSGEDLDLPKVVTFFKDLPILSFW